MAGPKRSSTDSILNRDSIHSNYHTPAKKEWKMRGVLAAWTLGAALTLGFGGEASACVGCKDAVSNGTPNGDAASMSYNWSIMLMLAVPLSLVSIGTTMVIRAARSGALPEL